MALAAVYKDSGQYGAGADLRMEIEDSKKSLEQNQSIYHDWVTFWHLFRGRSKTKEKKKKKQFQVFTYLPGFLGFTFIFFPFF